MKLFFAILLSFFLLSGCQTIENKTDKIGKKEVKEISKFIQQPESELKIVMGEPDEIKHDDKRTNNKIKNILIIFFIRLNISIGEIIKNKLIVEYCE